MPGSDTAQTDADILVRFRNIQKSYDGRSMIVKDLNLDIRQGEFLTLLGPSGSGKTTSLMMLAGFEMPTSGTIELAGRSLEAVPAYKRNIGMVFQNYALFPHMTVAENLAFPLKVRGMGKEEIKKRVEHGLSMVQLEKFGDRFPAQLSGGQQQRVALARALVFEPQLVLMDEPLGALDKQLREHMQFEIKRLHNKLGITVVYVTHDQGEALTMSDRVAVFNDGEIQQIDSPGELYERPLTSFVANFIGENNRSHGRIDSIENGFAKVVLDNGRQMQGVPASQALTAGDMVSVSIRPERVVINPGDGSVDQITEGEILEFIYFGDHVRLRLRLGENTHFIVKQPIAMVSQALKVGDHIRVGWAREFVRVLDPYQ
ncbi:MAG: ABC transporter ATP-binding protein [Alcaligenaceae bacterium]|nr:ABC transporter ATP-binding protein [Alcaligenaceae bacterium]